MVVGHSSLAGGYFTGYMDNVSTEFYHIAKCDFQDGKCYNHIMNYFAIEHAWKRHYKYGYVPYENEPMLS